MFDKERLIRDIEEWENSTDNMDKADAYRHVIDMINSGIYDSDEYFGGSATEDNLDTALDIEGGEMKKLNDEREVTEGTYRKLWELYISGYKKVKCTRRLKHTGTVVRTWTASGEMSQGNYYCLFTVGEYNLPELFKEE